MSAIDDLDDRIAADAFRRLVAHLRHREDAANIDLMALSGFCRNCLSEWIEDASAAAGQPIGREEARALVYGEPYKDWKSRQPDASAEQVAAMEESLKRNESRPAWTPFAGA
ncbi:DUF1244 domain-containing protein [Sphingomonas sp. ID0503]|jgi:hypothetical protein|uniref:DUF1244 domain-containing protein n=1 Tax=Sphingomonas sp. ID0503 TaxID=3399691 RepID=UPI003AFAE2EC